MKFQKVKSISISDTVAEKIEQRVLSGSLLAGAKLPPERELADQFNVSRPSIREAINKLQARGIVRKVPGGGNYITDEVGSSFADPLFDLIENNKGASYEILELRFAVEGLSAYFAAKRATKAQKENIKQKYKELVEKHREGIPEKEAAADVDFHIAIAEASNNPAVIHLMRNLLNVLQVSISNYFEETESRQISLEQEHGDIMQAVLDGNAAKSRGNMRKHIAGVEKRIARLRYDESQDPEDLARIQNLTDLVYELESQNDKIPDNS